jgi:hypothetical protein
MLDHPAGPAATVPIRPSVRIMLDFILKINKYSYGGTRRGEVFR